MAWDLAAASYIISLNVSHSETFIVSVSSTYYGRPLAMNRPFSAKDHLPAQLFSVAQIRELDRLTIAVQGDDGFTLMHEAATSALSVLQHHWVDARKITVIAGPGNNGGDAFILAALAFECGIRVRVFTLGDLTKQTSAAQKALNMAVQTGISIERLSTASDLSGDVLVDGLLGTGLSSEPRDEFAQAIAAINAADIPVLALDVPSGLNADSGVVYGPVVKADVTITFIGVKRGLLTASGPDVCGALELAELSVIDSAHANIVADAERISWARLHDEMRGLAPRRGNAHKGHFGHVLVIGGESGFGGAAMMAVEAAGRIGAGLVSCATRPEHVPALLTRRPEVMALGVNSGLELAPAIQRATILAIGPGLGQTSWSELLLQQVLGAQQPVVLDADALNLLASPGWHCEFSERVAVLTPHPGEAARMLGMTVAEVQTDRFASARLLAQRYQAVVVLKGQGSLIADPSGRVALCTDGNPGMSCGGMGDVLTGVIAALLAQGLNAWDAACLGVCCHSAAADVVVADAGVRGLLATDLMPILRELIN